MWVILLAFIIGSAVAEVPNDARPSNATMEQRLGFFIPSAAEFRDEKGFRIRMGNYLGVRPVILVLAYYRCANLCTLVLNGLTDVLRKVSLKPGVDYDVVTISIDPKEKPELALMKHRTYLARMQKGEFPEGVPFWHFLTGTKSNIDEIAERVGFHYFWDPISREYAHPSGLIILTSAGKISHYLAGIQFDESELKQALMTASEGRVGSWADRLFLACFHYDPKSGTYSPKILSLLRFFSVVTVVIVLLGLFTLNRRGGYR